MKTGDLIQQRYRVDALLGQGSMGTTCKALDLATKQHVAVKALHFSNIQEWKTLELFRREAATLRKLDHPYIPKYLDFITSETDTETKFFLVQEYIEGKTLQQLVEDGWRGTEDEILDIFRQLVDILEYLHSLPSPAIHRDITPGNIILSPEKNVFLVDFGTVQDKMRTTLMSGSTIAGTFGYMPFEQFSGQTVPASDYYALGATLLYLLTHRPPSEFPTEGMKIHFQPYLQASPNVIQLLNGLLEPAVEQRLASPQGIRKLLQQDSTASTTPQNTRDLPYGSKIRKQLEGENLIRFILPAGTYGGVFMTAGVITTLFAILLAWGTSGTSDLSSLIFFCIAGVIGFGFLAGGFYRLFGTITFELTPEYGQIRYAIGRFGHSKRFPFSFLDVAPPPEQEPGFGISLRTEQSWLNLGRHLMLSEKYWLASEIQQYLTLYAKPVAQSSAIPPNSKIRKHSEHQNHVSYLIPGRLKLGALGSTGIIGLSKMLVRTVLELTPEQLTLRFRFLGLGYSKRIPLASLRSVELFNRTLSEYSNPDYVIQIQSDKAKPLQFGKFLTPVEQEWLVREINDYLAKFRNTSEAPVR